MSARYPSGLTASGFFLIGAIAAINAGNWQLASPLLGAFVLGLLFTFAPKLPLLHRMPWIGAPTVDVEFRLFGGPRLDVTLANDRDGSRSLVVEVAVINGSRVPLREALVTVLFPSGIRDDRCTYLGEPADDSGSWLPPHPHQLGSHENADRWSSERDILAAQRELPLWFRLRVAKPGDYPLHVEVSSRDLNRGVYHSSPATLRVRESDRPLPVVDRISEVIDEGEALRAAVPALYTGHDLEHEFAVWIVGVMEAVSDAHADRVREAEPRWSGRELGDDFRIAQITATLTALYELRLDLGRER